ncbi:MAG TPA: hypothetical protein VKX46_12710 [Ktedonobacteraceae bacterium]|nr:hypothetical protein [Ktedonobacteraceae bacterium]
MHASAQGDLPHIGERYSSNDLFARYPGYWVLLAFPEGLTAEQEWDIMNTPGVLVAMEARRNSLWQARKHYLHLHPGTIVYQFATDMWEDLALIGGM